MPTTYTHDLFGKMVYHRLPQKMQDIIRKNGNLYRIGLHGPDIFFYYLTNGKITGTGIRMHREPARDFFEKGMGIVRETGSRPLLAYLLGFACHYLLDSACHPYVNQVAGQGEFSHTVLEKEFDRALMLETGKNPHHFYPSDCIVPKRSYARVIHKVIPEISAPKIYTSLRLMKFITNAMVYDNRGKRTRMLGLFSRIAGKKNSSAIMEYFMAEEPIPGTRKPVRELNKLFESAVTEAPEALEELFALSETEAPLSERWNRTYNG
ncbi:MAG: zinc dependent phospholipase C family protein [Eubacteriales bacterium]|nr:zinc dependent phospholipase C family protein [Eubacteriales bacterium]